MSYKVEILETNNKLEISSSVNEQAPSIEIVQNISPSINIVHDIALLPSDFNDNTENVIKSFLRSGYGVSLFPSGDYLLVQTSGLQPSGNYSLNGHNHSSLDITDLNSSVSGLLPVKNIVSGSGISVSNNNSTFTVAVTGQFGLTAEQVDDRVNSLLVGGTGISLSYDDFNDRLTISTVGLQPSGNYSIVGHSHTISDISNLQNTLDNKASLTHSHSAEAIVSGTLDFNRLPFTVTYPVRAVHIGGVISFNSWVHTISPTYYLNGSFGDMQTVAVMNFPSTSVYVDISESVTKYLNDYPGRIFTYVSLEVVLIDAANRIVGWGTTASIPAVNPSNGTAGTSMTVNLLSFPSVPNNWVIGGLPTSGTNAVDILPITAYKKVASRWLDIEKHDWNNIVNPPSTFSPSSHTHGNITNIGTIGTQTNQILITSTSGLITTTSDIPSSQIRDFNTSVSGLISGIYAPLHSPALSGVPTAPTANSGNSSSQIANTQFVRNEISNLVNAAPNTLDTLNELAAALGNDPNFATTVASGLGSKASLSGANFVGNITAPSGDFVVLTQNGTIVSTSGHKHYSNDILDFNATVSGLLPVKDIIGGNNITISNNSGQFTVAVTGQLGLTAEQVDDRVSGLLSAGNYVNLNYSDENNLLTISVTGLQPSGNYSLSGHGHTINDISNLQNSLDQKASLSGANFTNLQVTGVPVSLSGHKHLYNDVIDFASGVADNVTTLLVAGNNINLSYDAQIDTLTINTTGLQPVGNYSIVGHQHTVSDITNFTSGVNSLVSGIYAPLSGNLSQFSTTSSSQLRNIISDETGSGFLVFADNPTLSGVTINGNLTVSGSGLVTSNINNFDAQVRTNRLDQMSSPTNNISLNSKNITNLADPINNQDAATKAYVDAARAGLDVKQSVRAASTSSDTAPAILSGFRTVDGVALSEGDRVLMKNTNPASFRGIFVVSSGIWSLATDANTNEKVTAGMFVFVEEGDTNADSGWVLTTNNPITIGTTPLTFAQFSGAGQITAGSGLIKNGNTLDVIGSAGRIIVNADNIDLSTVTQSDTISPAVISTVVQDVSRDSYGRITGITTNSIPLATTGIKGIASFDSENFSVSLGVATIKNSGINNFHLINSSSTIGSTNIVLGSTILSLSGLASVESSLFSGNISSPTGNFLNKLTVNNVDVSVSGHSHISSNITDFNSSVSGLLPVTNITGNSGIVVDKSGTSYNVSTSGLAYLSGANFTGNISAASGSFSGPIFASSGNFNSNLRVNNVPVSVSGHTHTSDQITDSTSFGRNILTASSYAEQNFLLLEKAVFSENYNNIPGAKSFTAQRGGHYLIPMSSEYNGLLQYYLLDIPNPSVGDYYTVTIGSSPLAVYIGGETYSNTTIIRQYMAGGFFGGQPYWATSQLNYHSHTVSQITDFSTNVSGLLPVRNIIAGSYTNISSSSGSFTVSVTGLQPSGNYSLAGHNHDINDVTNLQSSLDLKANITSPAFSGIPTVPTATSGTNSNQIASTSFVRTEISNLIGSSPATLDTLNELATALGNDPNFATTVTNNLASKANLSGASFTGSISAPTGIFNRLGLGTTNPQEALHIEGDITLGNTAGSKTAWNRALYVFRDPDSSNAYGITIGGESSTDRWHTSLFAPNYSDIAFRFDNTNNNEKLNGQNSFTTRMLIRGDSGYVGIGNSSPQYSLDVIGTGSFSQNLLVSGIPVSISGHAHTSSNITDFNSSVSGLLPVTNILGGTNISVVPSGTSYTVSVSGQLGLTAEEVDDRVSSLLTAGSGINLNYNDNSNTLTVSVSGNLTQTIIFGGTP